MVMCSIVDEYYEECMTSAANSQLDKVQLLSVHLSVSKTVFENLPGTLTDAQNKRLAELHSAFASNVLATLGVLH